MQKAKLVKAIYLEIRQGLPELPAGEAIELAHRLLRAYVDDPDQMKPFGRAVDGRSIARLPVDEALRNSWQILEYELEQAAGSEELDADAMAAIRPIIERYLGPEWQQHSQVRPL